MKLLKFWRPGCVPCQFVSNLLNDKGVVYEDINAIENEELRDKYQIQSVPVLILLDDNGNVVDTINGYDPERIENLISQL